MKGYFISFEGPDGAGKSSVINRLSAELDKSGIAHLTTREPGGSEIAEKIRRLILDPANEKMTPETEALLYAAQRGQHVSEVIRPALAKGKIVLSDRYVDSSLAYQGSGRGLGFVTVKNINDFATHGLMPNLTLLFKIDPRRGLARINRCRPGKEDRLEEESINFHRRVFQGFLRLAAAYPDRIKTVDADRSLEQVTKACWRIIQDKLHLRQVKK